MNVFEVFDVAIGIEKRLSNMYYRLSAIFKDNPEMHNFWIGIANHEKGHSETLTLSKGYLQWNPPSLQQKEIPIVSTPDIKELEALDVTTRDYERRTRREKISIQDALEILIIIENSELNHLYNRLVRLSGFKFSQKPEHAHKTIFEHMKVIKSFVDKHYRGALPSIRMEDYKEARPLPSPALPQAKPKIEKGVACGRIVETETYMTYGFITGDDGQRYMFLPEDLANGKWEDARLDTYVEFSVIQLPWGPRATNINFRN